MINYFKRIIGLESGENKVYLKKLQKWRNIVHECDIQKNKIKMCGDKILNIIENANEILILYRVCTNIDEAIDPCVIIRMRVITIRGIIMPDPCINATYFKNEEKICIGDIEIFGRNINCGYGTLMIKELVNIAQNQNVRAITGWISPVDLGHIKRLRHFYEKNGFAVSFDMEKESGKILWENK